MAIGGVERARKGVAALPRAAGFVPIVDGRPRAVLLEANMSPCKSGILVTLMAAALAANVSAAGADQAALKKEAKISEEKAREIALKHAPGTVKSAELEKEK